MEDLIERTFAPADGPSGLIVYVGQRTECVVPCLSLSPPSPIEEARERTVHLLYSYATHPASTGIYFPSQMENGYKFLPRCPVAHSIHSNRCQVAGRTCFHSYFVFVWGPRGCRFSPLFFFLHGISRIHGSRFWALVVGKGGRPARRRPDRRRSPYFRRISSHGQGRNFR